MPNAESDHSAVSGSISRQVCPGCGSGGPFRLRSDAKVDPQRVGQLAFASRKAPELMHHRLVTCPACDLLFANPIPPTDAVEDAYAEAAFDSSDEARYGSRTYARLIDRIRPNLPDSDGVLDIGTGEGSFLEELDARGFGGLIGVEPSAAPVAEATPAIRALIRQEPFDPRAFKPESFALITCFQTLEHVFEPGHLVRDVLGLLKPGGAFVAVGHDRRAPANRILGKKSPIFDIEHLQLFSARSARTLLARAGYERIQVKRIINRYPVHYWAKLLPVPGGRKAALVDSLKRSPVGRAAVGLPAGNQVLFGFKPRA